ncbi:hypothetical protein GFG63_01450 [Vibrio parahaemolyticus]|nr:hypothetical protein [Vibrio parahaemolyticus]
MAQQLKGKVIDFVSTPLQSFLQGSRQNKVRSQTVFLSLKRTIESHLRTRLCHHQIVVGRRHSIEHLFYSGALTSSSLLNLQLATSLTPPLGLSVFELFPVHAEKQYATVRKYRSLYRAKKTQNHVRHRLAYETSMNPLGLHTHTKQNAMLDFEIHCPMSINTERR